MKITLLVFLLSVTSFTFAQPYQGTEKVQTNIQPKAAGCVPASSLKYMEYNNVRMIVHTAGNLWQVPNQNYSVYEVPKNSGIMALFTAALWLGGTDVNGQLKLAALRYRSGQDYWTGPLSQGAAEITPEECVKYDRHFITQRDDIREFITWYELGVADAQNGTSLQSENFPNYQVPEIIKEWPAHGDPTQGQDYYLAPFFDYDGDGTYNWENGDYPWHDIKNTKVCTVDRAVSLYGDLNYWWVLNDKGNIHTETGSDPIGMEIRAQAFTFASNDEINNMTFYNYELINRGTQTLANTYFGAFTDGALGDPYDDYVGCDVNRGLGYYYNGNNFDGDNSGFKGYGNNPPAVGVDFFEGPYQDNDDIDNAYGIGENEALNGIGYGDGIVDNERFGMRRFLYYSNTTNGANPNQTDPINAVDYYNYLRGYWKDATHFLYGGSGHISDPNADPNVPCDFMFPGDTDPLGWGTNGQPQEPWTEVSSGNTPNDRRFVQSAGPFVLKPGAVNNITVGVVWARATTGDAFGSVEVLRRADDKAQALFENCFRVLEGPHAPEMGIQELENELILTLYNPVNSNNYHEEYEEFDPFIVAEDSTADKFYRFQGYQIFQLVNASVAVSEIEDASKARLVAQCDIKDDVATLFNFEYDDFIQTSKPVRKVEGTNTGINHSFRITEDLFALGTDKKLVNHKTYYYVAISYAHNNYKTFNPNDPTALDGQKKPYLSSRKAASGEVQVLSAVPHNPMPEADGTYHHIEYGSTPRITRIDGVGNGGRNLKLTAQSTSFILANGSMETPTYEYGAGPVNIKVVDPLNVAGGYYELKFEDYNTSSGNAADTAKWVINRYASEGGAFIESISSDRMISSDNEQLIPEWGVSVQVYQKKYVSAAQSGNITTRVTDPITATISYSDSSKRWLSFIADDDLFGPRNWIRSGVFSPDPTTDCIPGPEYLNPCNYADEVGQDNDQVFENLLGGGVAPHRLTGYQADFMPLAYSPNLTAFQTPRANASISYLPTVDIVITSDQSKWTRCPVIELGRDAALNVGGAEAGEMRKSQSVGKNGLPDGSGTGMGWFPGYAIDLETGTRLHMAFGENSFLGADGGSDMIWNPSNRLYDNSGNPVMGGVQPIWVFGVYSDLINDFSTLDNMQPYNPLDENNNYLQQQLQLLEANDSDKNNIARRVYGNLYWIVNPLLMTGQTFLSSDVTIHLAMNKEYKNYVASGENGGRPMYSWSMDDIMTTTGSRKALADALDLINIVPNPYLAFSEYERNRIDTRVKITNLPEKCSVHIYSSNGKLVKTFKKDSPVTSIDWLLVNNVGIPIASGVYLVHVEVPGVGERVLKSFIGMRQVDLQGL